MPTSGFYDSSRIIPAKNRRVTLATQTEKLIQSLALEVTELRQQVATLREEQRDQRDLGRQLAIAQSQLAELTRVDLAKQVAVLQAQLAELTKTRDLWGQRGWAVFTVAVSAVFSLLTGTATALVAFDLNSKK